MLMIVPLMIWSARTVMLSHAWSADTRTPAAIATTTPTTSAGVAPKNHVGSDGAFSWTTSAPMNPANAAVSIMPSMPMFTTPPRSFMIPHRAPSAIGVASPMMICAMWRLAMTSMR